jgi:HD-like signal output (HDOD) protein/ActR/RegA family two-component response regulator
MKPQKHMILFVDDDPLVLRGFQRSLDDFSDDWETEFAVSGKEGLECLSKRAFDAVITDMHMPSMDGIQLLEEVSRCHPGVIRFVLSGNTSDAQILKSTHLVHQIIPKPSEMEKIYKIVERACRLRGLLSDPMLLQIINSIRTLPSVPRLYQQLLEQLQSETVSSQSIGKIISQDTAMTAKILQLVNSAFFGISEPVSSPQKAVAFLGINTIKSLALGIQIFSGYQNQSDFPLSVDVVWKHSLQVTKLAYTIACQLKFNAQEIEDTRVAGVLHDIGQLLSFQIPGYSQHVRLNKNGQPVLGTEYEFLGTSHAEMGGYLLGIWGLPNPIVEAVTLHHFPGLQADSSQPDPLTALHLANGLINMCQNEQEETPEAYLDLPYLQKLGLLNHLADWVTLTHKILAEPV